VKLNGPAGLFLYRGGAAGSLPLPRQERNLRKNLKRWLQLLDVMVVYWSGLIAAPCRLVVFPEFGLHGLPQKPDGSWNGVAIDIPGEETELLGKKAKELNIYPKLNQEKLRKIESLSESAVTLYDAKVNVHFLIDQLNRSSPAYNSAAKLRVRERGMGEN